MKGMEMDSPAVARFAPSAQPALELIALAQLSPERARQKLRALLLANPNYFGKIPSSSFMAVLKIQEDTTFECISRISYDPERERLCTTIDIKQATGYSGDAFIHGSQEFVRFYLSYDGGSKWLDQGMRSLSVFDSHLPRPLVQRVTLEIIPQQELCSEEFVPKIRAILSWNSPPPAGAPNWTPVWGNVVESDFQIEGSQVDIPGALLTTVKRESPKSSSDAMKRRTETSDEVSIEQRRLQSTTRHSTKTDPQHDFLAFVLAKAATFDLSIATLQSRGLEPVDCEGTEFRFRFAKTAKPGNPTVYEHVSH
jgi:hypothetical protein